MTFNQASLLIAGAFALFIAIILTWAKSKKSAKKEKPSIKKPRPGETLKTYLIGQLDNNPNSIPKEVIEACGEELKVKPSVTQFSGKQAGYKKSDICLTVFWDAKRFDFIKTNGSWNAHLTLKESEAKAS